MKYNILLSSIIFILLLFYVSHFSEHFDTDDSNKVKYFELSNEASNLVNSYKEQEIKRDIKKEKEDLQENVEKIVSNAKKVLNFTEVNKDYIEKVLTRNKNHE